MPYLMQNRQATPNRVVAGTVSNGSVGLQPPKMDPAEDQMLLHQARMILASLGVKAR